jgi:hypothetical protein
MSRKHRASQRGDPAAVAAARAAIDATRCAHGMSEAEHGSLVDKELATLVPGQGNSLDPCTTAVLAHIRARGWRLRATQLAMRSREWNFATAADVMCEDRDGALVLVEVKASRWQGSHRCYETPVPPVLHAQGMRSAQERHQAQLYAMHRVLTRECGVRVSHATVLRVTCGIVFTYPLNEWFARNDATVASWFTAAASGGGGEQEEHEDDGGEL